MLQRVRHRPRKARVREVRRGRRARIHVRARHRRPLDVAVGVVPVRRRQSQVGGALGTPALSAAFPTPRRHNRVDVPIWSTASRECPYPRPYGRARTTRSGTCRVAGRIGHPQNSLRDPPYAAHLRMRKDFLLRDIVAYRITQLPQFRELRVNSAAELGLTRIQHIFQCGVVEHPQYGLDKGRDLISSTVQPELPLACLIAKFEQAQHD